MTVPRFNNINQLQLIKRMSLNTNKILCYPPTKRVKHKSPIPILVYEISIENCLNLVLYLAKYLKCMTVVNIQTLDIRI